MKYRSRTEIVTVILDSVRSGATKTKIMYKAYLSYSQLTEYMKIVQANHVLAYDRSRRLYSTTKKGIKSLNACGEINDLMSKANPSNSKRRVPSAKRRLLDEKSFYN